MASSSAPRIVTLKAGAAISKGMAVKFGADQNHVVKGAANTDRCFGIAQNDATAAEDPVEVAIQGGGGKAKLSESVNPGDYLVSHTDGTLAKANAEGDVVVAVAMQSGVLNDIIGVEVVNMTAHAAIS